MGNAKRSISATTICNNRIAAIMAHTTRYAFIGTSRLAADAGIAKATACDLLHGRVNPRYITVEAVVKCLEDQLGRRLSFRDVIRTGADYETTSVCQVCGCKGCLPDAVYENDGSRNNRDRDVKSGQWTGDVDEFKRDVEEMTE